MSDSGNNPEWWIDGVSVGADPENTKTAPEEESRIVVTGEPTSPRGVPVSGGMARGPEAPVGATAIAPTAAATGTLAHPVPPPEQVAEQPRKRRWPIVVLLLLILLGIFLVIYFIFLTGPAEYSAHTGARAIAASGNTARVAVVVKNTGTSTGTPKCTVHITTATGASSGAATIKEKPIEAGKSALFVNTIKVTKTAAPMVKSATITAQCN
jgi:hypothetical protein